MTIICIKSLKILCNKAWPEILRSSGIFYCFHDCITVLHRSYTVCFFIVICVFTHIKIITIKIIFKAEEFNYYVNLLVQVILT